MICIVGALLICDLTIIVSCLFYLFSPSKAESMEPTNIPILTTLNILCNMLWYGAIWALVFKNWQTSYEVKELFYMSSRER
jgi:hypothetical protein